MKPVITLDGRPPIRCPGCQSPKVLSVSDHFHTYDCGTSVGVRDLIPRDITDKCRVREIELLASQHRHPGVNPGGQTLAGDVVRIARFGAGQTDNRSIRCMTPAEMSKAMNAVLEFIKTGDADQALAYAAGAKANLGHVSLIHQVLIPFLKTPEPEPELCATSRI